MVEVVTFKLFFTAMSVLAYNTVLTPTAPERHSRLPAAARPCQVRPTALGVSGERRAATAKLGERWASKGSLPGLASSHTTRLY